MQAIRMYVTKRYVEALRIKLAKRYNDEKTANLTPQAQKILEILNIELIRRVQEREALIKEQAAKLMNALKSYLL